MTSTNTSPRPAPAPHRAAAERGARGGVTRRILLSWPMGRVVVVLIALAGAAVLIFPHAESWFADRSHQHVITGYAQQQGGRTSQELATQLEAARSYNAALPAGPLRDPFANPVPGGTQAAALAAYRSTLDLGPNGLMGVLSVPEIGVNLPIYHGTSATALDAGIGHLIGTALPVGGPGTHAVLTGHSGVVGNPLFTRLHELHIGDTFTITVLNQTLSYQVDQVLTVLPTQTSALRAVSGRDLVTLATCTPIGINSHRLLVRGHRVPTAAVEAHGAQALSGEVRFRFPWWALIALAALAAAVLVTAPLAHRPDRGEAS